MSSPDAPATSVASVPAEAVDVARVPTWLLLAVLAAAATVLWLVGFDNGQASAMVDDTGTFLHEFFHDA
ncbi:MAG: CbtB domain-containing protein, partial [Acidimicrobiales bacterium]